jgi:large subunit ribosomal protein L2
MMLFKHLTFNALLLAGFSRSLGSLPLKSSTTGKITSSGRNHTGQITIRRRGGGHKRSYREIEFQSCFDGREAIVERLVYDPQRSAKLASMYVPGFAQSSLTNQLPVKWTRFYILAPTTLEVGSFMRGNIACLKTSRLVESSGYLNTLPLGTLLHCIGTNRRKEKGILQRAAGTFGQLIQKGKSTCTIRLSSGEYKELLPDILARVGPVSIPLCKHKMFLGKAGASRWSGKRPSVRGVAMNPVDHPHGGGEGKSSGGRPSVTPWAKPAHGRKTKRHNCVLFELENISMLYLSVVASTLNMCCFLLKVNAFRSYNRRCCI